MGENVLIHLMDTYVIVKKAGMELSVKMTLMSVILIHVKMEETVPTQMAHLNVFAIMASMEHPAKMTLMNVIPILAKMEEHVLILMVHSVAIAWMGIMALSVRSK